MVQVLGDATMEGELASFKKSAMSTEPKTVK